jgi:hypothetical protein
MALPRFRANLVRAGDSPDIVAARNFDSAASVLEAYARRIETQQELIGDLEKKISRTNLSILPKNLFVTAAGATVLSAVSQSIFADATAGNIALTVPSAVGNTGLTLNVFKVDLTTNTVTINGIVLGGNAGQSRLVLVSDGTNWRTQVLYEEGTYTATLTGCTTSPTVTVSYTRNGKGVNLRHASVFAISNSTACTLTGMPSHIYPGATTDATVTSVYNAGNNYPGIVRISTVGVVTPSFYDALTAYNGTFTNSATNKGFANGVMISYITA